MRTLSRLGRVAVAMSCDCAGARTPPLPLPYPPLDFLGILRIPVRLALRAIFALIIRRRKDTPNGNRGTGSPRTLARQGKARIGRVAHEVHPLTRRDGTVFRPSRNRREDRPRRRPPEEQNRRGDIPSGPGVAAVSRDRYQVCDSGREGGLSGPEFGEGGSAWIRSRRSVPRIPAKRARTEPSRTGGGM